VRDRQRASFEAVAADWLNAQRALVEVGELAPRTLDGYELSARRHLLPFFGSRPIASIAANDLVAWHAAQRRSGAAAWSIKGRWNAPRGVLAHAVRHELLAANPADALTSREKPKPGPSRKRFLTEDEMAALLNTATGRYRVLVALLLFSGCGSPKRSASPGRTSTSRPCTSASATSSAVTASESASRRPAPGAMSSSSTRSPGSCATIASRHRTAAPATRCSQQARPHRSAHATPARVRRPRQRR
jgi:hypothetical protein